MPTNEATQATSAPWASRPEARKMPKAASLMLRSIIHMNDTKPSAPVSIKSSMYSICVW